MNDLNIPFRPVRGTEESIQQLIAIDGYLYFATDSRKTYLGTSTGEKILMGYDTGVFYGKKDIPKNDSGAQPDPIVYFNLTKDIEGDRLPQVNDLILNSDGCFYRVENIVSATDVKTRRLTLQGTGGGGGTGPSGPDVGYSWSMWFPSQNTAYSTDAEKMELSFETALIGSTDNHIIQAALYWGENLNLDEVIPFFTTDVNSKGGIIELNTVETIDITSQKSLFAETNKTVTLALTDKYGVRHSAPTKIRLVKLELIMNMNKLLAAPSPSFEFSCDLDGVSSGVIEKKIVYTFYKSGDDRAILTIPNTLSLPNYTGTIDHILDISSLEHGSYKMTVQAFVKVTGMSSMIASNILTHQVGYVKDVNSPILLTLAPDRTEQYTDIEIEYLYVTNNAQTDYTLEIRIDNIFYKNLIIKANESDACPFYFEDAGQKRIAFTIMQTGASSTEILNLTPYSGELPIIDRERVDLMLYLNPKGKTNNDADKNVWVDSKVGSTLQGQLTNVNYSQMDGWLVDETTGESYLKLISGATFEIPNFRPFNSDLVYGENDQTRVRGVTIELDFEIDGVVDATQPIISCISKTASGLPSAGFEITGSQIKLYNNRLNGVVTDEKSKAALTNQTVAEGQRIKISMVIEPNNGKIEFPMAYTYISGKLTEAVILDRNDRFVDTNTPALLKISSEFAQIKIYGIRFYSSALTEKDILNNYTAALPTNEERQREYDSNNVYRGTNISYELVSAEDYNLEIPYMVLTGGYPSERDANKKCLWKVAKKPNTTNLPADPGLPTDKKDYRFVDVEVIYPNTPLFEGYQNYSYKNEFENGGWITDNVGNEPTNGGAIMYCQGTSSMEYPVKNLRLRWKNSDNYFTVKPDLSPVEIICMKADYMESSGSHNTGAANLIDDIYANAGMQTPGQEYGWDSETRTWKDKRIVTCIKGHPCLIFYSPTGEAGSYEYIGKYNLNLDKATPEPFGFIHDDETGFGYLKNDKGELVLDANGKKQNSIFCYEFLDNEAYPVCNFEITKLKATDDTVPATYYDTWYKTFWNAKEGEYYPGWRMGFESRYPDGDEGTHDADAFYPLANWINELHTLRTSGDTEEEKKTNNKSAIDRFADEYWKYLDKDFTLSYYLITEALLMADSRVKNMMIATWGPEWRYRLADGTITSTKPSGGQAVEGTPTKDTNEYNEHFGYIFYPIFYDMDTMLGLNNEGRLKFNYYEEDTDSTVYNGHDVLWNLVRDALPTELIRHYNRLEGGKLHAPNIIPYFNDNQADLANEAFYNGDAAYKYVNPAREGYQDLLKNEWIAPGAAPYLYALQGDRMLHREAFINDRMQYLRGKYTSTKFLEGDYVAFRWNTPSDVVIKPSSIFNFTGLKTGYAGVQLGKNGSINIKKFTPGEQQEISVDGSGSGTEAYILGVSALSDLGDLSNKYMSKFVISSPNNRLERVQLGNPHKEYRNDEWATSSESIAVSSPTLKEFNLQNCSAYTRIIDFTNNPVIEKILMTGSGVSGVTFPDNGVISELRLPNTITTFKIRGHQSLTNDNFSMGTYEYGDDSLIGGDGGRYVNDFSKIQYLEVINTNIDTYAIVDGAIDLISYNLQGIDWEIKENKDQYCRRTQEEVEVEGKVPAGYYQYVDGAYKPYEADIFPTGQYYLYEKVSMTETRVDEDGNPQQWITCIPMLERLLTLNTGGDDKPHNEALSGTIKISVPGTHVIELDIYDKYKDYYPNITIEYDDNVNVKEAYKINFYPGSTDHEFVNKVNGVDGLLPGHSTLTAQDASRTLNDLIGTYVPVKIATTSEVFVFTGQWVDWANADADDDKPIYYQAVAGFEKPAGAIDFTHKPQGDMDLVPVFESRTREYQITLYNDDKTALVTASIGYGENIGNFFDENYAQHPDYIKAFYNYKQYTDESKPDYRWSFKGWKKDMNDTQIISYLTDITVTGDMAFYAYYKEENVHENVTMVKYIDDYFDISGTTISLKDKFIGVLEGKITLPSTNKESKKLTTIGTFSDYVMGQKQSTTKFTHIYMKNDAEYSTISNSSFQGCTKLEFIDLTTISTIGLAAFQYCTSLKLNALPDNLTTITGSSFNGMGPEFKIIELPNSVTSIQQYGLGGSGINISTFGSETSAIALNAQALDGAGNNQITSLTIYTKPGFIKEKAFLGYKVTITDLKIYSLSDDLISDEEIASWNLQCSHGTTITNECVRDHRN